MKRDKNKTITNACKRKPIPLPEKLNVWVKGGGRCIFCNTDLLKNGWLDSNCSIGEMAHIVGWSENSPRGDSPLTEDERNKADNLILVCPTCHQPIDKGGKAKVYTVERLHKFKHDHEKRIQRATEAREINSAHVVRFTTKVRGFDPGISPEEIYDAMIGVQLFPIPLKDSYPDIHDIDLRKEEEIERPEQFQNCLSQIEKRVMKLHSGIEHNEIKKIAIFGIGRIPLLVALGARIGDKIPTEIFQRHRRNDGNPWAWPETPGKARSFRRKLLRNSKDRTKVALVLNLTGTIQLEEIPADVRESHSIYEISPTNIQHRGVGLFQSRETLSLFEEEIRSFLGYVEIKHSKDIEKIEVFPAIGAAPAIKLGQVRMPNISPSWVVYDRDENNVFHKALEVKR